METSTTFKLQNGKILETTITEKEHDQAAYVAALEQQIIEMQNGLDEHTLAVTNNIQELQNKLNSINSL